MSKSHKLSESYRDILHKLDEYEIKKFGSLFGGATVSPYTKKAPSKVPANPSSLNKPEPSTKAPSRAPSKVPSKTPSKAPNTKPAPNTVPKLIAVKVVDSKGNKFLVQSTDKELKFYEGKTVKGTITRENIKGIWIADKVLHIQKTDGTKLQFLLTGFDRKNTVNNTDIRTIAMYLQHRKPSNKKVKKERPLRPVPPPAGIVKPKRTSSAMKASKNVKKNVKKNA